MLVLTRSKNSAVKIGHDVVVTVRDFRIEQVLVEVAFPSGLVLRGPHGLIETQRVSSDETGWDSPAWKGLAFLKKDETLCIGEDIKVMVVKWFRKAGFPCRVSLGFEAPKNISIARGEVADIETER